MNQALSALAAVAIALCAGAPAEAQVRVAPRALTAAYHAPTVHRATTTRSLSNRLVLSRSVAAASPRRVRPAATRPAPTATPGPGRLQLAVTENGRTARGTVEVRASSGRVVARGDFTRPLTLPAGRYALTFTLTTALDRPTRTVPVTVRADRTVTARAAFETAIVEVRFFDDNRPVYGRAVLSQGGQPVGSVGSRIVHTVSAGRYDVTAQYRGQTRSFAVDLAPGQRRAVNARF